MGVTKQKLLPAEPVGVITPPLAGTRELHRYSFLCVIIATLRGQRQAVSVPDVMPYGQLQACQRFSLDARCRSNYVPHGKPVCLKAQESWAARI
jgi:hypothetical protein